MDIETLKTEGPITELLGHYGWREPFYYGSGTWTSTLCPFHDDTRPSASVNLVEDKFHCFTCSVSGDIIDIVQDQEGLSVSEAIKFIEEVFLG